MTFHQVTERFFGLCHDNVPDSYSVSTKELSASFGNNLGEVYARYNVLGSAATITLYADRIAFDVPNFTAPEIQTVFQVVLPIHDAFHEVFPELKFDRVETESFSHLELGSVDTVAEILNPFRVAAVQSTFGQQVVERPVGKIDLVAADQSWAGNISVEKSAVSDTAIFAAMRFSLRNQIPSTSFMERLEQARIPSSKCLAVFNLEADNVRT